MQAEIQKRQGGAVSPLSCNTPLLQYCLRQGLYKALVALSQTRLVQGQFPRTVIQSSVTPQRPNAHHNQPYNP